MKKIIISTLLGIFVATSSFADWIENFSVNNQTQGVEVAVAEALKAGMDPTSIVDEGLKIAGINPQHLLKALYCEGTDGDDVKAAADSAGISDLILVAAFEKVLWSVVMRWQTVKHIPLLPGLLLLGCQELKAPILKDL